MHVERPRVLHVAARLIAEPHVEPHPGAISGGGDGDPEDLFGASEAVPAGFGMHIELASRRGYVAVRIEVVDQGTGVGRVVLAVVSADDGSGSVPQPWRPGQCLAERS